MKYGLYLAASGALTSMHRQDVLANNLANVRTVGFKPDSVMTQQRLPERLEDGSFTDAKTMLERLGGGVHVTRTRPSLAQGSLEPTSNPLDLAIEGEGFFAVRSQGGGADATRLTRDGRFTMAEDGRLVTTIGGLEVLDANELPIRLDPDATAEIDQDGNVRQDGAIVATLRLVPLPEGAEIEKAGHGTMRIVGGGALPAGTATGRVQQGFTEASAVDPILALNAMIGAAKAAQGNIKMMQFHDYLTGQAVNVLGRVS